MQSCLPRVLYNSADTQRYVTISVSVMFMK